MGFLDTEGITVLSLCDGIGCGRVALERAGIKVKKYYASEVDKHAIEVMQKNYPDTIQVGCIKEIDGWDFRGVDLLMAGTPCQGFSFSGKGYNFDDPRSKLFFQFAGILRECSPKYWLLENVVMQKEYSDVISDILKVQPVKLDSALTSAQIRKRLYWANFPISEPGDAGVEIWDVLENAGLDHRGRPLHTASIIGRKINERGKRDDYNPDIEVSQCLEVRKVNRHKSNCLTTVAKDTVLTPMPLGRHPDTYGRKLPYRDYTVTERCRLMNLPDDYCDGVSYSQVVKMTGNGWEVGMVAHIFGEMLKNL